MNILLLAYFATFMIYVWLIFYVLSKNPNAKLNIVCTLLISCFAIWSFSTTFYHMSATKNDAMLWNNISSIGWISFSSFSLWFCLIFTKKEKILKKWYLYFIFFVPVILIFMQWTGHLTSDYVKQSYGWTGIWSVSIWANLYYVYYISFLMISFYLVYSFSRKTQLMHEKKQAMVFFFAGITNLVLGVIIDNLLSRIIASSIPATGSILALIWTGGMVYAISKYKLLVLTSSYAARDILSTMSDSLFLIDPECKIVEVNNATLTLLNYTRNDIIEKPASILFAPEDISLIETLLFNKEGYELLLNDGFIINRRINYLTKAGEKIPIDFSGSVMKEKTGNVVGIVCIARDIREIIKSEKEKEKLDKLKNNFIANITHDFRSPLTAILNVADLELRFNTKIDKETKENYNIIYKASIKLKNSIDRLLEIAQMDALGVKLNIKEVNPTMFLQKILTFFPSSVIGSGIKIIQKFKDIKIDNFYTDIEKLEEIIDNVLSNAIKFVDAHNGEITIDLVEKEESIIICIEDNGIGISKDDLEIIFNRFEQANGGKTSRHRGTGIGLAFARQLIGFLKGRIWAESEGEGKGSKFFIELKKGKNIFDEKDFISEENEEKDSKRKYFYNNIKETIQSEIDKRLQENEIIKCFIELNKENEYDYKKGVILIVDDDKIIREIIMKYLVNNGYKNFILASDGRLALDAVYEYTPDLIICDYNMPNMKGDEFHNELIDSPKFKEIPFIFLSAIADENLILERRTRGAVAYLKKPINEKILMITVDENIKKHFEYLKISQLATIDELTGLNNRRAIITTLKHELAIRKYRDLSLIFFDLDFFKEINDTYGHQTGDVILSTIGKIIKSSIRSYDISGRYGGDEFIIILPDTNLDQAIYIGEILRKLITNTKITLHDKELSVSSSFGVASLIDNAEYIEKALNIDGLENIYEINNLNNVDWVKIENYKVQISEVLLELADMAMYKAKQTVCNNCKFSSEKKLIFNNNICPKCGSNELTIGRNKIVGFE